jgi:adenosylmethionine-8-amino-7-oxononanoate aminotransferase
MKRTDQDARQEHEGPSEGTEHQLSNRLEEQPRAEEFLPPSRPPAEPPREALVAWDDAHCWHPFTQQGTYRESDPLLIVAGDGHYLIDMNGRRYLDGSSSRWCTLFGHRRPELNEALREQLDRIAHSTFYGHANVPAVTLARRLAGRAPGALDRVFFTDDGSTAVRAAFRMAEEYWQRGDSTTDRARTRLLAHEGSAHRSMVEAGYSVIDAPVESFLQDIEDHGERLAAVLIEPGMLVEAGAVLLPPGFTRQVREATQRAGTLLIADETAVGFGRSGQMFASGREGIEPDLLCLSNGLTGGYIPMGATLATTTVYERFLSGGSDASLFAHGHGFSGNQLAASAALATLDIFDRTGLLERLQGKAEYLDMLLASLREQPGVRAVRQYGLIAGIEMDGDAASSAEAARQACLVIRRHGVFLLTIGGVIIVAPPLTISHPELDLLAEALAAGCDAALGVPS